MLCFQRFRLDFVSNRIFIRSLMLLFLCGSGAVLHAQSPIGKVDSLQQLLTDPQLSSPQRGELQYQLAKAFFPRQMDSVISYATTALGNLTDATAGAKKAELHLLTSIVHNYKGNNDAALEDIEKAETLGTGVVNDTVLAKIFFVKGTILAAQDDYEQAVRILHRSLALNEKIGQPIWVAKSYVNLGKMYSMLGKNEEAKTYYEAGIKISEAEKDSLNWAIAMQNYGVLLKQNGDTVGAAASYEKAVEILLLLPQKGFAVYPLSNLCNYYLDRGELKLARARQEKALELAENGPQENAKAAALLGMGKVLAAEKKFSQARDFLRRGWEKAEEFSDQDAQIDFLTAWATVEETAGNFREALRLERDKNQRYLEAQDLERTKFIEELTIQYETEKKETENALLRDKENNLRSRQKWMWIIATVVAVMLLLMISLLFRSSRRQKFFNQELAEKNKIIEQKNKTLKVRNELLQHSNQEKNALMSVVAHDLKAPMTKISAMMQVLKDSRDSPVQFQKTTEMISGVIKGGENLIEELVLMSNLEDAEFKLKLEKVAILPLLETSFLGFAAQARAKYISMDLETPDQEVLGNIHTHYFSRIIDNLISNALKFSFRDSAVTVALSVIDADSFLVEVRDQGPGIPAKELPRLFEKFTALSPRPTAGESSTGLGLSIAKELVQKMHGEIAVRSEVGRGTVVTVRFPRA